MGKPVGSGTLWISRGFVQFRTNTVSSGFFCTIQLLVGESDKLLYPQFLRIRGNSHTDCDLYVFAAIVKAVILNESPDTFGE